MYQLNYHSKAITGLKLQDLQDILEEAIAANAIHHITGCLIYHDKSFVQILEGSKEDVLHIFGKIKTDKRHHTVIVLWENHVDKRFFAEWNMAYYRPNTENVKNFVNNLLLLSKFSDKSSGSLLSFWASVRKIIGDGTISEHETV